ncbi:hypothetical protein [Exiguobacterium sp. s155]|uniref:hypothetical protein n=1 Tax=Exiguobacterium sp. s155 TaxID=2751286 RepID=UPI001BE50A2D|nr:hypothetical protein [Exiguobacterium sp. s155]
MNQRIDKFPDYFPQSCPPLKQKKGNLTVYRIVESNTIKAREFIPIGEKKKRYLSQSCNSFGISLITNPDDLKTALNYFAQNDMKRKNKAAIGIITPDSGVYAHAPSQNVGSSHINWWTYIDVKPHTFFNEILEIGVDI